jgi:hypothetical protein
MPENGRWDLTRHLFALTVLSVSETRKTAPSIFLNDLV